MAAMTETPRPPSALSIVALLLFVLAVVGLSFAAVLAVGPVGLSVPVVAVGVVLLHRLVVQSSPSSAGKTAVREIGAALMGLAVGFGTFVAATVVGIMTGTLPFLSDAQDYPHEDAWTAGSVVLALVVSVAAWWALRRFADPDLRCS